MIPYKGQIRLVKHPYAVRYVSGRDKIPLELPPPKMQQFDGETWKDVEILEAII